MSSEEARAEAEWRFPVTAYECPEDQSTEVERFVAGAEWQAERDAERVAQLEAEVERLNDALDAAHVRHGMATDWGARLQAKLDAVRADAWEDGYRAARADAVMLIEADDATPNPYRKETS